VKQLAPDRLEGKTMPQPQDASSKSATDKVVRYIHDELSAGRLLPGSRIYEGELVEQLGVSRSSMRVAMRQLSAMGLVDIIHHKGIYIKRYSRQELEDRQKVREALEGAVARLAAGRASASPHQVGNLRAALGELSLALEQGRFTEVQRAEVQIADAVAALSQSSLMVRLLDQLKSPTLRAMFSSVIDADRFQRVRDELATVVEAIAAGDADAAEARMRAHVRASSEMFARTPQYYFDERAEA
jgi:DNA-binding GntR family transcriptional regulator